MENTTYKYSDLSLSFKPHPFTSDVVKQTDDNAIKTAVKNILYCNKNEKIFRPDFGSDLDRLLFEPLTLSRLSLLKRRLKEIVEQYESRVKVKNVDLLFSFNLVDITLTVEIQDENKEQITVNYNIEKTR